MANPIHPGSAFVDPSLSTFASAYKNNQFIADRISPIVDVDKASGKYFKRNRRDVSKVLDDRISSKGQANEATYDVETAAYSVEDRALRQVIPSKLVSNADAPLSPEEWATANCMQRLMLAREKRVADLVMTQGNWSSGNYATVLNYWSDEVNGTPLTDLQTALEAIPSTGDDSQIILVMSLPVAHALMKHPQMLGLRAGGGSSAGQLSANELASFLGIGGVFVSKTFVTTSNEGQTATYSRVWSGTKAALVQVPRIVQGPEIEAFTVTFREQPGIETRRWNDQSVGKGGSDIVQVEFSDDEVVVQNDQGYLLQGVLA